METLKFKNTDYFYFLSNVETIKGNILGSFLNDDVVDNIDAWITWVNNSQLFTSSNVSRLYKDDKHVYINDLYTEGDEPCFVTTRDKFIKMLHDWDRLIQQQPNYIRITIHDNGDITLQGSDD